MRTYVPLDEALQQVSNQPQGLALVFAAWVGFAWVFSFRTKQYLATGELFDRVVGGGYTIVADDGSVSVIAGNVSWTRGVGGWAKARGRESEREPWIVELATMSP